jgi:hypothetical protein
MGQKIKKKWYWRKKTTRGLPEQDSNLEKWKDIAVRAAKTFLQAFIASIPVDAALLAGGWNVWRAALMSAAAAGVSAVMNFILAVLQSEDGDPE